MYKDHLKQIVNEHIAMKLAHMYRAYHWDSEVDNFTPKNSGSYVLFISIKAEGVEVLRKEAEYPLAMPISDAWKYFYQQCVHQDLEQKALGNARQLESEIKAAIKSSNQ